MKSIIKKAISTLISWLIALGLLLCLTTFCLLIWSAILAYKAKTHIPHNAALVLNLNHDIIEEPINLSTLASLVSKNTKKLSLLETIIAIDRAAEDPRISSLFLQGNLPEFLGTPYTRLKEIRDAIERFKASGKPVIAYIAEPSRRYYYLASTANDIYMNPMTELPFTGIAAEMMFLGNTFQKYGVGVQTPRAGKYKSAIEMFTRTDMSPENKEQTQEYVDNIWEFFLADISRSRFLDPSKLQEASQIQGLLNAEEAHRLGLIDRIAHYDIVIEHMESIAGKDNENESFNQVNMTAYAFDVRKDLEKKQTLSSSKIAIVYANGSIVNGQAVKGQVSGDKLAKEIRSLRKDKDIKGIILRVDSPGGSVLASDKIEREIYLAQQTMPVITSMGPMAASGGYWIAARTHKIFCHPTTITGSIGVFSLWFNIEKLSNDYGVTWDTVRTSPLADLFSISRFKTPTELDIIQKLTDNTYSTFLQKVADGRRLSIEEVKQLGEGRVWTGQAALKNGLADEPGGLIDAINYIVLKAQLGTDWSITQITDKDEWTGLLDVILDEDMGEIHTYLPGIRYLKRLSEASSALNSFDDPNDTYALMPYRLNCY